MNDGVYKKGRGAQLNIKNRFSQSEYVSEHLEGIDEGEMDTVKTQVFHEHPKKIVNQVNSPDLSFELSMNPYQGCEHGCSYCYARPTHEYWGFSAGLDFESKIIVKVNAPQILERTILNKSWQPKPIMLSGNTDCYQPLERKYGITRELLKVLDLYRHPVSIITKNQLILRDLDVLKSLSDKNLVKISISVTSLNTKLINKMEPRTSQPLQRIKTIERLSKENIPVGVMIAPVIPGLNNQEIPGILKSCSDAGAIQANMTMIRLNGPLKPLFKDWLEKNFPDRFHKVWNQIRSVHGGSVNDSRWGKRMKGEGPIALSIHNLFKQQKNKYFQNKNFPEFDYSVFIKNGMMKLF